MARCSRWGERGALRSGLVLAWVSGALACSPVGTGYRSLHEVDGQVVHSAPPPPAAYESYLRARLALEQQPPQLDDARVHIERAIEIDPRDPHLWATRAEIEEQAGRPGLAAASARRALSIRPGYAPAQAVLSRVEGNAGAEQTPATGTHADVSEAAAPQP